MVKKIALAALTASFYVAFPVLAQGNGNHGSGGNHGEGNNGNHNGHGNNSNHSGDDSNHSGHDDDGNSAGHRKDAPHGFGDPNLVLTNHADAAAVATSMTSVRAALQSGTFTTPAGNVLPPAAQGRTYAILSGVPQQPASIAEMSTVLSSAGPKASAIVPSLVRGFSELSSNPARLPSVISTFNSFTNAASNEFITNPPPEFLALHSVLARLSVAAGTRAK